MRQKPCWVPLRSPCLLSLVLLSSWVYFFNLPFLANVLVEVLLILCIPWKNNLQLSLNFPVSIPCTWAASLYSSQDTHSCFYCQHNSFLHFSLIRRPLLSDASLLLSMSIASLRMSDSSHYLHASYAACTGIADHVIKHVKRLFGH